MARIVVNGSTHDVADGGMLLSALEAAGVRLPAMCHDDRLAPSGACRLCLVRIDDQPKPVTACTTAVVDGLRVTTDSVELGCGAALAAGDARTGLPGGCDWAVSGPPNDLVGGGQTPFTLRTIGQHRPICREVIWLLGADRAFVD